MKNENTSAGCAAFNLHACGSKETKWTKRSNSFEAIENAYRNCRDSQPELFEKLDQADTIEKRIKAIFG